MNDTKRFASKSKIQLYNVTKPLLSSMYLEFKELAKKKPDATMSKTKIKIVNRLLEKLRIILADEVTIEFLDILDEDDMPQISDVTLILSQYVASMRSFKSKYTYRDGLKDYWRTEDVE